MKKLEYLKSKKEVILKIIMLFILLLITIKIFFNDKLMFLSNLIQGNGLDYCMANNINYKFHQYGKNISEEYALEGINNIIKDADNYSYKQLGYLKTYGKSVHENHYSLEYKYTYSKEQDAHKLEIDDYMYISDDVDNNLIKKGTYIIATVDGIEYIFIKENNNKTVLKSNENTKLYNEIISFGMKSQISKIFDNKFRIKTAKTYKNVREYIIDFDNFRSGIRLVTYGNNKVLSYNFSKYNEEYNYINDMSFKYTTKKINIPKLEDYI